MTDQETHMAECNRLIRQFRKEFKQAQTVLHPPKTKKRCVLFEVMCSSQSELTRQCTQLNVHARRFGREQGDLSTTSGRKNLFAHLIIEQPEHVWIAPECRPWCRWSLFNEQRSLEHFLQVAAERIENIWQIALCVVLCEHQLNNDRHFHLEQPNGSLFLQHPSIVALEHATQQCRFDMCLVGGLKDPKTKEFIRKRMTRNRFCRHDHNHHQIAGSTKVNGQNVPMSAFTELYPRKFARQGQVAKSLIQRNHSFHVFAAEETEFDHPTKRRRLGQKSSRIQISRGRT